MRLLSGRGLLFLFVVVIGSAAPNTIHAQEPDLLLEKVMQNDLGAAKELVASGADIDQQNQYGHTPLIIASNYGFEEIASFLISAGADIHVQGSDGATALIAAASHSRELVEILLSKGADINAKLSNGTGAFTQSTNGVLMERVSLEVAELLLANGADVDEAPSEGGSEGHTSLIRAAGNDHEGLVRFLIEHGADVNAKAKNGSTPLSVAVDSGNQAIADILKAAGAKAPGIPPGP